MKKTATTMVNEALALITTHSVEAARALLGQPGVQFVDLRDPRELEREGAIPGAFHAPRGMLEFWVDTESPYHKPVFNQPGVQYVLFCGGGWRSALAARTMQEMGIDQVSHIHGGFGAWKAAGFPVEAKAERPARVAPGPAAS